MPSVRTGPGKVVVAVAGVVGRMLLPALLGCESYHYEVERWCPVYDYVPLDGYRTWTYVNEGVDWPLVLHTGATSILDDGTETVTIDWTRGDTDEALGSVTWSSAHHEGVFIHAWSVGDEEPTVFNAPVGLTDKRGLMQPGDTAGTTTNGCTFLSELVDWDVHCRTQWSPWDPTDNLCIHMRLDDGDGDDDAGPNFAGDYWFLGDFGAAWMRLTGYPEIWNLYQYDGVDDPDWSVWRD